MPEPAKLDLALRARLASIRKLYARTRLEAAKGRLEPIPTWWWGWGSKSSFSTLLDRTLKLARFFYPAKNV